MNKIVAEKLAAQISDWCHRGLISNELFVTLKKRYSTDVTLGNIFLRWLGFLAVFLLGMSILGVISLTMGDIALYLAPFVLSAIGYLMWFKGTKMAIDPEQHYPTSGAVLVTVGLVAGFAALVMLYELFDGMSIRLEYVVPYLMLIMAGAAYFTAYRYGLRWPLTLGVLLVFHGIGNMHSYGGQGSYFLGIQDEHLTFIIAMISIVLGIWHEKAFEKDHHRSEVGFGQIYIVLGLLYANLCLWFLSIEGRDLDAVLVFSAASVTQIILGGKFHDGRLMGFGIVFLSINIYTRMFEHFWDALSKGAFFLISGTIALAIGIALEWRSKQMKQGAEL